MNFPHHVSWFTVSVAAAMAGGCGESEDRSADKQGASLLKTSAEPAGGHCPSGGIRIDQGQDLDDDKVLDTGEIAETDYVCDKEEDGRGGDGGAGPGSSLATSLTDEPAGKNCPNGGQRIEVGTDTDGDSVLDEDEVSDVGYLCNGPGGALMSSPQNFVMVTEELAGANCETGGQRIDSGVDTNESGNLETSEIESTTYVCNGVDGAQGFTSIIVSSDESPGANCPDGGERFDSGVDNGDGGETAGDDMLGVGEIDDTAYACDGPEGEPWHQVDILSESTPSVSNGSPDSNMGYSVVFLEETRLVAVEWLLTLPEGSRVRVNYWAEDGAVRVQGSWATGTGEERWYRSYLQMDVRTGHDYRLIFYVEDAASAIFDYQDPPSAGSVVDGRILLDSGCRASDNQDQTEQIGINTCTRAPYMRLITMN